MPDPSVSLGGHQFALHLEAGGEVIPGPDPSTDDGGDAGHSESEQQTWR